VLDPGAPSPQGKALLNSMSISFTTRRSMKKYDVASTPYGMPSDHEMTLMPSLLSPELMGPPFTNVNPEPRAFHMPAPASTRRARSSSSTPDVSTR
jgi:hypothetical protein